MILLLVLGIQLSKLYSLLNDLRENSGPVQHHRVQYILVCIYNRLNPSTNVGVENVAGTSKAMADDVLLWRQLRSKAIDRVTIIDIVILYDAKDLSNCFDVFVGGFVGHKRI